MLCLEQNVAWHRLRQSRCIRLFTQRRFILRRAIDASTYDPCTFKRQIRGTVVHFVKTLVSRACGSPLMVKEAGEEVQRKADGNKA